MHILSFWSSIATEIHNYCTMRKTLLAGLFMTAALYAQKPYLEDIQVRNGGNLEVKFGAFWISDKSLTQTSYEVFHARKTFEITTQSGACLVQVSADNRYKLYLNGQLILQGPQASDWRHWKYDMVDIGPFLKKGKNVVAAEVVNFGKDRFFGQQSMRTAFMMNCENPDYTFLNTEDKTWKTKANTAYKPNHPNWMYGVDIVGGFYASNPADSVYAAAYPWGWQYQDYDDTQWNTASYVYGTNRNKGGFLWSLEPRATPIMKDSLEKFKSIARENGIKGAKELIQKGKALTIPAHTKCSFLVDQTYLTVGNPEMVVSGGKEGKITITYAENLYTSNKTKGNRNDLENKSILGIKDVYVLDGGLQRKYSPLWWRAFRFVQVDVETKNQALTIESYTNVFSAAEYPVKARFEAKDPVYKNIWNICHRTAGILTHDNLVSDAYYEQMMYVGDSRVHAMTNVALTGDSLHLKNAIQMFNYSRMPDGMITSCYPLRATFAHPTFTMIWVDMLHDYMMYFGNKNFLKSYLPQIRFTLDFMEQQIGEKGIPVEKDWNNFVDWYKSGKGINTMGVSPKTSEGNSCVVTLHYVYTLQNAAEICSYLGLEQESKRYMERAAELRTIVKRLFYDEKTDTYWEDLDKTYSDQRPNIMAVLTNMVEVERQAAFIDKIAKEKDENTMAQAGMYYRFNLYNAMIKAGSAEGFDDSLYPWKQLLDSGLTSTTEVPLDRRQRSEAHPWSTSPVYAYLHLLAGVHPSKPAQAELTIQPKFGKFESFEANYVHPKGIVKLKLSKKAKSLFGTIDLPHLVNAQLVWGDKKIILKQGKNEIDLK